MDKNKGIEQQASRTALSAAMVRHMVYKDAHPDFPGTDDLARLFLPPNIKSVLFFPFFRRILRRKFVGGYEYIYARTIHFDQLFRQALDEDIPQIVLMGAGYDTRAVRFEGQIKSTRIFELDAPYTQEQKQVELQKAGIAVSSQVTYVPVNFSQQSLDKALLASGFDPAARTLFLWEGVTFYLSAEDVARMLEFIRVHSGAGSQLVFDYSYRSAIDGTVDYYGAKETAQAVSEDREPFTFGIEEGTIESYLVSHGFSVIAHYDPEEFAQTYLTSSGGERLGAPYGFVCNVICEPSH
jgi:methyltransferase (TIGR00027 family)